MTTMAGVGMLVADAARRDPAERRRSLLLAAAVAGGGAFLLAAAAVVTIPFSEERQPLDPRLPGLAPFIAQGGLRPGVAFGAVLLVIPFLAFAAQALRVGTAARERRLAALRLAGATRADLRRVAAVEGGRAGLVGALLVAPAYLVLWVLLGLLPPPGARMLPPLLAVQVAAWLALVPVLTLAGAAASTLAVRAATVDPLGAPRRRVRPVSGFRLWLPVFLCGLVLAATVSGPVLFGLPATPVFLFGGLVLSAATSGPGLMVLTGRWAVRRRDLAWQLAGHRLLADPRTPGRAAGVLVATGLVGGVVLIVLALIVGNAAEFSALGMAAAALLGILLACGFAVVVSALALLVGATEQVLEGRRPAAVLSALGAPPGLVTAAVERQVTAAAAVPAVVGVLTGWVLWIMQWLTTDTLPPWTVQLALPPALLVAFGVARVEARIVTRLLRAPLAEAASVENLRAA